MSCICTWASPIVITSPSAQTKVVVDVSNEAVNYSLYHHGNKLLEQKHLTLILDHETLGDHPRVASTSTTLKKYELHPVIALKQRVVSGSYRNTIIHFKNHYALEFRVMDDAVAYRFILQKKGKTVDVLQEPVCLTPSIPVKAVLQTATSFRCNYEDAYTTLDPAQWSVSQMATTPLLLSADDGSNLQMLIGETGVRDYPRMFFKGDGQGNILSAFPHVPVKWTKAEDGGQKITEEAPYIARTDGNPRCPGVIA